MILLKLMKYGNVVITTWVIADWPRTCSSDVRPRKMAAPTEEFESLCFSLNVSLLHHPLQLSKQSLLHSKMRGLSNTILSSFLWDFIQF